MKEETKIYPECGIRSQIFAGGASDWRVRLGKYTVSLQYVDCPDDGLLGRLASLVGRVPQRLVAVVYQRNRDGQINAIQVSNLPQRNDGMRGMKAMIREAMLEMPAPIVSVVDINKEQKLKTASEN